MIEFRVVDLRADPSANTKTVFAQSPERAAELALGLSLVRSGAQQDLRAQVYSQHPGQAINMVRLYTKVADRVASKPADVG